MIIVSKDGILSSALEAMLEGFGLTGIQVMRSMPQSARTLLIVDADSVSPTDEAQIITISKDRARGADLLRPFSESQLYQLIAPYLAGIPRGFSAGGESGGKESAPSENKNALPEKAGGGLIFRGRFIALTPAEQKIAYMLIDRAGRVVPAGELIAALGDHGGENMLRVYVRSLRQKLDFSFSERIIYTVRGKGYLIKPEKE